MALRQGMEYFRPPAGEPVYVLLDVVQSSHIPLKRRCSPPDSRFTLVITNFLVVAKFFEPVLVDPEIVSQFVEDGDPDFPLELGRIGE